MSGMFPEGKGTFLYCFFSYSAIWNVGARAGTSSLDLRWQSCEDRIVWQQSRFTTEPRSLVIVRPALSVLPSNFMYVREE